MQQLSGLDRSFLYFEAANAPKSTRTRELGNRDGRGLPVRWSARSIFWGLAGAAVIVASLVAAAAVAADRETGAAEKKAETAERPMVVSVEDYFPLAPGTQWVYRVQSPDQKFAYRTTIRVVGHKYFDSIASNGVEVLERYASGPGPLFQGKSGTGDLLLSESSSVVYFHRGGYLNRVFMTTQGGKLVPASAVADPRVLPDKIEVGKSWDAVSQGFRVGGGLGFRVSNHQSIVADPAVVRVPAGEFENCIRVDSTASHGPGSGPGGSPRSEMFLYYSDWYARGVGLVRTQEWEDQEHQREQTRVDLLDYEVKSGNLPKAAAGGQ